MATSIEIRGNSNDTNLVLGSNGASIVDNASVPSSSITPTTGVNDLDDTIVSNYSGNKMFGPSLMNFAIKLSNDGKKMMWYKPLSGATLPSSKFGAASFFIDASNAWKEAEYDFDSIVYKPAENMIVLSVNEISFNPVTPSGETSFGFTRVSYKMAYDLNSDRLIAYLGDFKFKYTDAQWNDLSNQQGNYANLAFYIPGYITQAQFDAYVTLGNTVESNGLKHYQNNLMHDIYYYVSVNYPEVNNSEGIGGFYSRFNVNINEVEEYLTEKITTLESRINYIQTIASPSLSHLTPGCFVGRTIKLASLHDLSSKYLEFTNYTGLNVDVSNYDAGGIIGQTMQIESGTSSFDVVEMLGVMASDGVLANAYDAYDANVTLPYLKYSGIQTIPKWYPFDHDNIVVYHKTGLYDISSLITAYETFEGGTGQVWSPSGDIVTLFKHNRFLKSQGRSGLSLGFSDAFSAQYFLAIMVNIPEIEAHIRNSTKTTGQILADTAQYIYNNDLSNALTISGNIVSDPDLKIDYVQFMENYDMIKMPVSFSATGGWGTVVSSNSEPAKEFVRYLTSEDSIIKGIPIGFQPIYDVSSNSYQTIASDLSVTNNEVINFLQANKSSATNINNYHNPRLLSGFFNEHTNLVNALHNFTSENTSIDISFTIPVYSMQ